MEDNIGTASDNKIPLIIGIGAIALAVLALAFAIKAKGDSKKFADEIAALKESSVTKTELSSATTSLAKTSDVTAVSTEVANLGNYVNTEVVKAIQAQKIVLDGLVKRPGPVTPGHPTPGTPVPAGPFVAGPGEYVVKKGDGLAKIAKANGVTLAALEAVNPGVSSKNLKVGQKLKLPEKK